MATRQSFAAKKQQVLASAAGLAPKEPVFSIIVSADIGPFKADQVLTTRLQCCEYLRVQMNEGREEHEYTKLTDDQMWAGIQTVSVIGIDSPEDKEIAWITYLEQLETTKQEPLDDLTMDKVLNASEEAARAVAWGELADKHLADTVSIALAGKQAWDGGPLPIEAELVRIYGNKKLSLIPVIGTRKTGQTHKKTGESKDNVPEGYNGTTDWFKVMVDGEPKIVCWSRMFIEAMPHVHQLQTKRKTVKSILNGDQLATIPAEYAYYCPPKSDLNTPVMEGIAADLSAQVTRNVNRITTAIAYWQTKNAIDTKLPDVSYSLVDDTPEATAKRTKPIQMVGMVEFKGKQVPTPSGKPISLSAFIRLGKFVDKAKELAAKGPQLAKLLELSKVKKEPKNKAPATVIENAINNTDAFKTVCANVFTYCETHDASIKAALTDARKSGEMAYWLKQTYNTIGNFINNDVLTLADAYDKIQLSQTAERAKADAEKKEAEMKAAAAKKKAP